jgi:hypothetical protein
MPPIPPGPPAGAGLSFSGSSVTSRAPSWPALSASWRRGDSTARIERMQQMLLGYVERKEIPGLVALVSLTRVTSIARQSFAERVFGAGPRKGERFPVEIHHDDAQMETFAQIPKSFSVSMAAGDSEWRWIFSATKSSVLQADSAGTAALAPRRTPIP